MAKKKDNSIKDALTLGSKRVLPKKTIKNVGEVEEATAKIHEETKLEKKIKEKEEIKKTSLHIPIDLYTKLKRKSFDRGITLRKLIIETLKKEFDD